MGKLDGACCYLSGAMEMVADHGVAWRRKFIRLIKTKRLQIDCIDPTDKPGGLDIKIGENKQHQEQLQRDGQFKELQRYVHSYRRYDLRFVDYCDFIVVAVTPTVAQWGSGNELYFAELQHKPRFLICEGGLGKLPRWLFDVIQIKDDNTSDEIFDSVESLVEHLTKLDSGTLPLNDQWVLIRKHIEENR